jgi:hypothetical protein
LDRAHNPARDRITLSDQPVNGIADTHLIPHPYRDRAIYSFAVAPNTTTCKGLQEYTITPYHKSRPARLIDASRARRHDRDVAIILTIGIMARVAIGGGARSGLAAPRLQVGLRFSRRYDPRFNLGVAARTIVVARAIAAVTGPRITPRRRS